MFMGEYHHNIDDKARIVVPSKFRYELGDSFIITRGLEGCLFVYSKEEWNLIVSKLKTLPFTKKDARAFLRFFLSGAQECTFDKQGRIAVPNPLVNYALLKKECVIIGVNDRIEIWAEDKFNDFFNENESNIADIAEDLFSNVEV
ncbi:MAG: division/cell wall cluster transcriptional repressor MraZ [Bacilli bacterium]|nr:division/cell wall cluster transcriptional repressor MraZ [Bacilli bacterium]